MWPPLQGYKELYVFLFVLYNKTAMEQIEQSNNPAPSLHPHYSSAAIMSQARGANLPK